MSCCVLLCLSVCSIQKLPTVSHVCGVASFDPLRELTSARMLHNGGTSCKARVCLFHAAMSRSLLSCCVLLCPSPCSFSRPSACELEVALTHSQRHVLRRSCVSCMPCYVVHLTACSLLSCCVLLCPSLFHAQAANGLPVYHWRKLRSTSRADIHVAVAQTAVRPASLVCVSCMPYDISFI